MMGIFISKELLTANIGNGKHRVVEPFVYCSDKIGVIVVPAGFITDFASVPRLPFVYMFFGGVGDEAAVLHDWLYAYPHQPHRGCGIPLTRAQADHILRSGTTPTARPTPPPAPPKDTGVACPECKQGTIQEKNTRRGKMF